MATPTSRSEALDDLVGRMKEAVDQAARAPARKGAPGEVLDGLGLMVRAAGKNNHMQSEHIPGPLEDEKRAHDPALGDVEPQAAEVESARLLVNDARPQLEGEGVSEEELRRLADEFIARDRGDDVESFVDWARERARHHDAEPPGP